jgi:hypothetical protein
MTTFFTPARAAAFNLSSVIRPAVGSCVTPAPIYDPNQQIKYLTDYHAGGGWRV